MKTVFRKALERGKEIIRPYYLRWLYFPLFPNLRPDHFQDCWRYPSQTIVAAEDRLLDDRQLSATQAPALLFFPMTDWHTRIQRTQHLARTFASLGHPCFYLNPHLGREFPNPYFFSNSPKLHILEPLVAELHIHLPFEPVFHDRLLTSRENGLIVNALKTLFEAEGTTRLVQMVSFPVWSEAARKIREQFGFPIVYDCHDVLSGFRKISKEIVEKEPELFEISDLVVFSSQELLNENVAQYPYLKDKSILVRNAVDESWLSRSDADRKGSAGNVSEIIVGYVGALDFWFDIEAIEKAARAHPNWKFLLIGRVEDRRILRLSKLPNIVFVGEVPHSELHKYMSMFRVALIPFLRNDLTIGTNPIKLYEYFSYGLPVVSTALPEMEEYKALLYLYDQPGQFTGQLEKAVAEKDSFLKQSRIGIAHRESWNARVDQLSEAFQNIFP
jgi:glycosyltransferase involved in cell wall biosynthesis